VPRLRALAAPWLAEIARAVLTLAVWRSLRVRAQHEGLALRLMGPILRCITFGNIPMAYPLPYVGPFEERRDRKFG
jgi:hypothetical protein